MKQIVTWCLWEVFPVTVAPVGVFSVVVNRPLIQVFYEGNEEEFIQNSLVEALNKIISLGDSALVLRCLISLNTRYSSKGRFSVPQNSRPLSVRIAPTMV